MSDMKKETQAPAAAAAGESLLDQIMQETRLKPNDEGYEVAKKGVEAFISELLQPQRKTEKVEQKMVDEMIAEIDRKLSKQVDEILHHEDFQKLESAWRGLKSLVDRTDFRENIKIEMLNVSKDDLLQDFEDAPEITKSGLYKHRVHRGVRPVRRQALRRHVLDYEFGPGAAGHPAPAEHRERQRHGARAVLRRRRPAVLRRGQLRGTRSHQGPGGHLRGPAVHEVALVPRVRGRALRRPLGAAFPAACALWRGNRAREDSTTRSRSRATTTTSGATRRSPSPRASPTASSSTAGARTSSARRAAARSRTCRCTSTRRWARARPSRRPRC